MDNQPHISKRYSKPPRDSLSNFVLRVALIGIPLVIIYSLGAEGLMRLL